MKEHKVVVSTSVELTDIRRPFSNFDFLDKTFPDHDAIRRLFSQARCFGGQTLVVEDIPSKGVITAENEEIAERCPDHEMRELKRVTFWKPAFSSATKIDHLTEDDLIGYAILKRDVVPSRKIDSWHIFESVFNKYPHRHNYIHREQRYQLRAIDKEFSVTGVMYCQQNELNKACAQVGLRSLCTQHVPDIELPYRKINKVAASVTGPFDPADGLQVIQIRAVLRSLGIQFADVDYTKLSKSERRDLPYQKFLYAGIESGAGALLGFKLTGPKAKGHHIIPFFGHTFNQDTWVPNAEVAYFHVGEKTRYIPSESWVSSFIGHDDNFGSNYCVPRLYVKPEQVQYVVSLNPSGVHYNGVVAEAIAVEYLYSVLPDLSTSGEPWLKRLIDYSGEQKVVLRTLATTKARYIEHLRQMRDWHRKSEKKSICDALNKYLPAQLWMIEVSVPELFPANQRKLGEIVLDAKMAAKSTIDFSTFQLARFPSQFLFFNRVGNDRKPEFISVPSNIKSHTPVFSEEGDTR